MKPSSKKGMENISNFIFRTFCILEDESNTEIVDWSASGSAFVIKDIRKFEEFILPTYFKHSNFSSFVRQVTLL